jgi:hypothetical protein
LLSGLDEMANDRRALDRCLALWGFSVFTTLILYIRLQKIFLLPRGRLGRGVQGGNAEPPERSPAALLGGER